MTEQSTDYDPAVPRYASEANDNAERDQLDALEPAGEPVVHSHGQHGPHVHMADDYASHQQPIDGERIYHRGPWFEPVEVITGWMRSAPRKTPCVCCAGPDYRGHVFCYTARDDAGAAVSLQDWVSAALRAAPEGARLRFSVEVIG